MSGERSPLVQAGLLAYGLRCVAGPFPSIPRQWVPAPKSRLQWRYRGGFAPPSLFSLGRAPERMMHNYDQSGGSVAAPLATVKQAREQASMRAWGSENRMLRTCVTVGGMSKTIQIGNAPDEVHREATVRAARAGLSLSDFVLRELERALSVQPVGEVLARIAARERLRLSESAAQIIRREREHR